MSQWLETRERGSDWTINLMLGLCKRRYRWLVNLLLYPISAYFLLTGGTARRASQQFFRQAQGRARWSDHYRQLLCFSCCLVDRVAILSGDADQFEVHSQGRQELLAARRKGRGMILLGSHLGNFEAAKLLAHREMNLDIQIVAYFGGSSKIRRALDAMNPILKDQFIDPTEPDAIFRMRDVIDQGGILAILSDRTGIGEKQATVDFMGRQTQLPTGPYYLAAILRCPVFCFFGLRVGDYSYDTYAIKLADEIRLSRSRREQQAQQYAQQYAHLLADKAREYPYNWFNFFPFWPIQENRMS